MVSQFVPSFKNINYNYQTIKNIFNKNERSEYKDIFDLITVTYTMLLVFLLLVFAILSRKIGCNNFKDTNKISISYIFTTLTFQSIERILHSLNQIHDAILVAALAQCLVVLLSQVFLIIPKDVPAFYYQSYIQE